MTRNQIIENLFTGKNFNDCIGKMEPAHLQEDLKMEVISIVCEWPEEKIINLHHDNALEFYVVRVILNQVKSKTSPFVKKYRQVKEEYTETTTRQQINQVGIDEARIIKEQLEDFAMEEIDKLYWYDAEMVRLYLKHGNFRAIEKETGIPFISCYKNIKKSLTLLKAKAIEKAVPLFSKEELRFIQNSK